MIWIIGFILLIGVIFLCCVAMCACLVVGTNMSPEERAREDDAQYKSLMEYAAKKQGRKSVD